MKINFSEPEIRVARNYTALLGTISKTIFIDVLTLSKSNIVHNVHIS